MMKQATAAVGILLIALSTLSHATALYRWVEADGSITFSPEPPTSGVDYELVQGTASSADTKATSVDPNDTRAAQAAINDAVQQRLGSTGANQASPVSTAVQIDNNDIAAEAARQQNQGIRATAPAKVTVNAPAPISYAPEVTGSATNGQRSTQSVSASKPSASNTSLAGPSPETMAARTKQNRCSDLKKRVISLERRLRLKLSPGDMDNTVVHMARYQRSYDQYCKI